MKRYQLAGHRVGWDFETDADFGFRHSLRFGL